ncbi:TRAP transporter small permease subunit [Aureimonas frigidaquae]|uniref:TRAP transporter small permease protein n=1 Tax=Aureimonas frigidaquae TaxID=424757 RepID=A0A0P0Z1N2_9HYPH|nr:TRAP transporter small permease [Aureimonas frigidaquae]BAT27836.1 hypothetical protein precursor [Aureimonas frigidaquae]
MDEKPALVGLDNPLARAFAHPIRWMQILMGWCLLALCIATTVEVLGRKFFGYSLQGVNEIGAYMLAVSSTWGFSMALLQRAHSRVDFLFPRFPRGMRTVLNLSAAVILAAIAVFAAIQGWHVLQDTLRWQAHANTPLQTPMWIPQGLWLVGLVVFAATSAAFGVHAVILAFTDRDALNRYYGPPSLQDQIDLETQGNLPAMQEPAR